MTPRTAPAKPALSREGIVGTAVDLARELGAERVTMRRLAQALDTGPASLYVYVRDTGELQAAMLDAFLAEVDLLPTMPGWRDRLAAVLASYTRVLYDRPSLARVALVTRPSGPHYLALLDAVLALLDEGGVPTDRAAWAVDVLLLVATASAVEHSTRATGSGEDERALVAAVGNTSAALHPYLVAAAPDLFTGGPERARWFVDVIVGGALTTPRETA